MKKLSTILLLAGVFAFNAARAQDPSNDTTARYFVIQASIGGLNEIVSAQMAAQKAASPEVKAFANRMITDHGKAQEQLLQLIKRKNMQIPQEATTKPMQDMMLKKTSGKDFDKLYVHMMVPDHLQTVQLFENYAWTGKDPDIKAFAQQMLPILKDHLAAIKAIDKNMTDMATAK